MGGGLLGFRGEALWVDKGWKPGRNAARQHLQHRRQRQGTGDRRRSLLLNFGDAQFGTAPFLQVGPDIGLSINNISRTDTDPATFSEFASDDWAWLDFGLNFGGGVSFRVGMGKLVVDARYNLGLTNMNKARRAQRRGRQAERHPAPHRLRLLGLLAVPPHTPGLGGGGMGRY